MDRLLRGDNSADETETIETRDAIVSYRNVTGYPLFVAVGFSKQAAFAAYDRSFVEAILAGICLSLISALAGGAVLRGHRRLERFHAALVTTMDNISQGILMIDKNRRMPVANRRVAELLEVPPDLVQPGADFDALLNWQVSHAEFGNQPARNGHLDALIGRGGIDPDLAFYERTRGDGHVLEVRTTILPDGGAVRTFTDITERKKFERALANARDAAEAGGRARTDFLAVMSHEIRTPLNGVIGAASLLQDMDLAPEQQEYVRIICASGDHLAALIQDILDFSRLDSGRLELETIDFDLRALIQSTIGMLRGQANAKGLFLTERTGDAVPRAVNGDPTRLRQILVNLIGNAIKFTAHGGVIVESDIERMDGGPRLSVAVIDSGIGIASAAREKLFSAFSQVDGSISRRFG